MVLLDSFLLVGVCIHKQSSLSQGTVLIVLMEAHFDSVECSASLPKGAKNEGI